MVGEKGKAFLFRKGLMFDAERILDGNSQRFGFLLVSEAAIRLSGNPFFENADDPPKRFFGAFIMEREDVHGIGTVIPDE